MIGLKENWTHQLQISKYKLIKSKTFKQFWQKCLILSTPENTALHSVRIFFQIDILAKLSTRQW